MYYFVLDFSTNMVNPCGKQYIVLSSTGIHLFNCVKALFVLADIVHIKF